MKKSSEGKVLRKAALFGAALMMAGVTAAPQPSHADTAGWALGVAGVALLGLLAHTSQPMPVIQAPAAPAPAPMMPAMAPMMMAPQSMPMPTAMPASMPAGMGVPQSVPSPMGMPVVYSSGGAAPVAPVTIQPASFHGMH